MLGRLLLTYPTVARRIGVLLIFALVAAALYALGISSAWIGKLYPPAIDWLKDNKQLGRALSAVAIALIIAFNWKLLQLLPRRQQIVTVWIELFVLLMLFFYSFDLSLSFIARKIGFMISQGVVTTLYISAISIAIATVIALAGAMAKLSKNGVVYGLATFYTSLFRGLPLLMQIYIIYLGLPQVGYVISAVPAGILALSLCYGALHDRDFPRRHREHLAWPDGRGDSAWTEPQSDDVLGHSSTGDAGYRPADRQSVHRHAERLVARLRRRCLGDHVSRPHAGADGVPPYRNADHRLDDLLGSVHGPRIPAVAH